jgi:hypothetical protein
MGAVNNYIIFNSNLINSYIEYWYASLLLLLTRVCLPLCIRIGFSLLGFFVRPTLCVFSNLFVGVIKSNCGNI